MIIIVFLFIPIILSNSAIITKPTTTDKYQSYPPTSESRLLKEDKSFWFNKGKEDLDRILELDKQAKLTVAKNVIIFVGDGMGPATVTATRIYKGQRYYGKSGEDHSLVYDKFPHVGLIKTYNVDMQVPDSAGTATALFTGVKTRYESIGIDITSTKTFVKEVYELSKVESIMTWAQNANKDTGIITTTRISHATPAATYAHINHRKWECDSKIPKYARNDVKDISRQLIEDSPGKNFKVILGGGYQQLGHIDNDQGGECLREDGLNLTKLWIDNHINSNYIFASNNEDLAKVDGNTEYLLGLFHPADMPYELVRDKGPKGTPSLTEMTSKGLEILSKCPNGFVLMVEGGRIDHGHHDNYARLALGESSDFDDAISLAVDNTDQDTLIIVTADHSHTMTLNGYGQRGNDILGFTIDKQDNKKKSSLTLTYANGPGFKYHYAPNSSNNSDLYPWIDPRTDENRLNDPYYQNMAALELRDETHGGEDVAIYAKGPGSHLIRGVMEQNYVAHLISYVGCFGPRAKMNPDCKTTISTSSREKTSSILVCLFIIKFLLL